MFSSKNAFIGQIISTKHVYYYINIFWFAVWAPFVEESFFRGYLYELLRSKGEKLAILMSSFLFALPHYIFSGLAIDFLIILEVLFIFLRGIVFTFAYRQGGLIASVIVHVFANIYISYF